MITSDKTIATSDLYVLLALPVNGKAASLILLSQASIELNSVSNIELHS